MRPTWYLIVLGMVSLMGCIDPRNPTARWGAGGQGTIDRQKARAVLFDPFPLNDIGPEVVGGRPREFAQPLPEANRNELTARAPLYPR